MVLVVDVANVLGSRPDGWWRDRAGATTRLLASLGALAGADVTLPAGGTARVDEIVAVVEGAARAAAAPPTVRVVAAPHDGDREIVARVSALVERGTVPLVVTADRGLRARLPPTAAVTGPRWLTDLL